MMFMYGCEAPWLNTRSNKTCERDLDIKTLEASEIDKFSFFYYELQVLDLKDFLPDCPKPCVTMNIKLKTQFSETGSYTSYLGVWKSTQVC